MQFAGLLVSFVHYQRCLRAKKFSSALARTAVKLARSLFFQHTRQGRKDRFICSTHSKLIKEISLLARIPLFFFIAHQLAELMCGFLSHCGFIEVELVYSALIKLIRYCRSLSNREVTATFHVSVIVRLAPRFSSHDTCAR